MTTFPNHTRLRGRRRSGSSLFLRPAIELDVARGRAVPREVARHPVPHEPAPALAVSERREGLIDGPHEAGPVGGVEPEPRALAGPGVPGLDRVHEPSRRAHD